MEFALSIPSVQWTSPDRALYRGPFFFTPRLYLNKTLPILLGYFYGLDKERGSMGRSNREYIVNDGKLNNPIIEGIFSPNGDMVSASHYPHLSAIVDDLNQPIIAQYHLGSLRGPFVASTFTWHIKKASLQPAAADILVFQDFLDGVVPDSSQAQLKVPPVQNFCEQVSPFHFRKEALSSENPLGVFRICTKWDYSFPFPAGLLRPKNGMLLGGASPETDLDRVPFEKRSLLQSIFSRGRK
ncbi:MAG: hypothetical protein HOH43_21225 [Candidatus Latescibacteria bacterium]|nr:hypothetical protein [Candidatus Latescibacterota bacterium]